MKITTRLGRRWLGPVALLTLLGTACSVSTPRGAVDASGPAVDGTAVDAPSAGGSSDNGTEGGATTGSGAALGSTGGTGPGGTTAGTTAGEADAPGATGGGGAGEARRASAPGVTTDTVAISIVAGFSGPLAAVVRQAYAGIETWRDDVNRAGGIHGRKLVLKQVDHKETADGGIAACKQAQSNGTFFAAVLEGVEANLTAINCLDAAGIPTLFFSGTVDPKWRLGFSDSITTAQGGKIMASYVRNKLGGTSKKAGVIYVNQLAYKAAIDAFVPEAKRLGVDVVASEAVEPNQASFTPQLLRMRRAGTQILVVSATAEAIGILRDTKAMGWSPAITGQGFTFDFVTVAARDLFKGVTGLRPNAAVDSAAYERYAARMRANGRGRDRTVDTEGFLAYGHGLTMTQMLVRAGENPTRASLVSGSETIRGYSNGILPPLTFSASDHLGAKAGFMALCCSSDWTWKSLGPPRTSF